MMNRISALEDLKDRDAQYLRFTDKLSAACRVMAFAEGAAFWAFSHEGASLNCLLLWGYVSLVGFFAADVMQYFMGMLDYRAAANELRELLDDPQIESFPVMNDTVNLRIEISMYVKLFFIVITSILLIVFFYKKFV